MSKCPHTEFRRGQRVLVILRGGDKFVDKFIESKSGVMFFEKHGRVKVSDIRQTTIYRAG